MAEPALGKPPETPRAVAVLDMGASSIRLLVAELTPGGPIRILEDASRGVLLGKDTFTHGRIGAATVEATLKALEGFRRIMDTYGVAQCRAVGTSAVREASNCDSFLDRVKLRTGIEVEVINGSEEVRLTYLAVGEVLRGHESLTAGNALLVAVGGGSADISFLRKGEPVRSGTYALGSIRMRQSLAAWHGSHDRRMRLLRRHIHNVVEDIRLEMPLAEANHFIALGSDVRFAASRILGDDGVDPQVRTVARDAFLAFCDQVMAEDVDDLIETYHLPQADAETLIPALMAYRELLAESGAAALTVPEASLRMGLLLDVARAEEGHAFEDLSRQVLASAAALGEKYHYDAPHARNVAHLAVRLFDDLKAEHGLTMRDRLLLEVAGLLHDIGIFVGLRGHHKHGQYILSASEIFGLSRDDMDVVSNVARYHRRALPQRSHLPYMALDRDTRVTVNKMAAILRVANALDADHLQKVRDVHAIMEQESWVLEVEGAGDLTMERLASQSRADLFVEVFGRKLAFRETMVHS
jgi:exopolyphosphatase / guanosine-5'-triphosphate,3'-diphosphate pyrophosphatase